MFKNFALIILVAFLGMTNLQAQTEMEEKTKKEFEWTTATGTKVKGEWVYKKEVEADGEINERYEIDYEMKTKDGRELERELKIVKEVESNGDIKYKVDGNLDNELYGNFEKELDLKIERKMENGQMTTTFKSEREIEVGKSIDKEMKNSGSFTTGNVNTGVNANITRNGNPSINTTNSSVSNVGNMSADTPFDDLPPTSEFGKCYAKCKTPDAYETITLKRLVKEEGTRLEKVPAVYETVTEKVLAKEGSTKYRTIPATFKTVSEQMLVEPEKKTLRTMPAKYETKTREILVTPARGQWVKKKKYANCFSENPEDCYVACYEEVAAVYRTEKYQVLVEPARTESTIIPAKYKTVSKKIIDQPARVEEIPVEAEYKTISRKVLVSPEATTTITIPAVYKDVKERRLISKGNYTVWTEILCASKTTNSKVRQVQQALSRKGYNAGSADGVMGLKTQTALRQYQQDNQLPIGNMNIETLKSLGIDTE